MFREKIVSKQCYALVVFPTSNNSFQYECRSYFDEGKRLSDLQRIARMREASSLLVSPRRVRHIDTTNMREAELGSHGVRKHITKEQFLQALN